MAETILRFAYKKSERELETESKKVVMEKILRIKIKVAIRISKMSFLCKIIHAKILTNFMTRLWWKT